MAIMSKDFYQVNNINSDNELPLLKDYLINLDTGETIIDEKTGDGIIVEGIDAVVVQAKRKLMDIKLKKHYLKGYLDWEAIEKIQKETDMEYAAKTTGEEEM